MVRRMPAMVQAWHRAAQARAEPASIAAPQAVASPPASQASPLDASGLVAPDTNRPRRQEDTARELEVPGARLAPLPVANSVARTALPLVPHTRVAVEQVVIRMTMLAARLVDRESVLVAGAFAVALAAVACAAVFAAALAIAVEVPRFASPGDLSPDWTCRFAELAAGFAHLFAASIQWTHLPFAPVKSLEVVRSHQSRRCLTARRLLHRPFGCPLQVREQPEQSSQVRICRGPFLLLSNS